MGRNGLRRLFEVVSVALVVAAVVTVGGGWLARDVMPRFAGEMRPVLGGIEIKTIEPVGDRASLIKGELVKLRDCRFVSIRWHLGREAGASVPVRVAFHKPPAVWGTGQQTWGLKVGLKPDVLMDTSYAYTTHDCGWPWLVETLFWRAERGAVGRGAVGR